MALNGSMFHHSAMRRSLCLCRSIDRRAVAEQNRELSGAGFSDAFGDGKPNAS